MTPADSIPAPVADRVDWILDEVLRVPETYHALLLSADGLLRAHRGRISRDAAERQAAGLSGLQSLSRGSAEFCTPDGDTADPANGWRQTVMEFHGGYVFLVAAGPGAYLSVAAGADVDLEAVTYRMQKLVDRLRKEMTSAPRQSDPAGEGEPQ